MGGGCGGTGSGGMVSLTCTRRKWTKNRATLKMLPRPQVDNVVAFLRTLSDGFQR